MTPEQEEHLQQVKADFIRDVDAKYRKGQAEHGGDLWKKPGVLEMLMDECVDFYVYAHVLREQRDNPSLINPELRDNEKLPTPLLVCPKCSGIEFNREWGELVSCKGCGRWDTLNTVHVN